MPLPAVSISLQNGGLGRVAAQDDRVMGLIFHGIATTVAERLPRQFFSYADVATVVNGLVANDNTNKTLILEQVADFYRLAGEGAELWALFADTALATSALFDPAQATAPARVLMEASGGRINVIGYSRQKASAALTSGFSDEVSAAIINAHTFGQAMSFLNMPCRIVLDGHAFTGDSALLPTLRAYTANRVAVVLSRTGSTIPGVLGACVGLVMGRLAGTSVQRNLGRVADGSVAASAFFTPTGALIRTLSRGMLTNIHDKGYIFLTSHYGRNGYFFNDDPVAAPLTDDFFCLSNGRVIDKAARVAYATYLGDLLDNVTVNVETGRIVPSTLKFYQGKIERAINLTMTNQSEISGCTAFVDPTQDVLGTSQLNVVLNLVPVGTNRNIVVRLGLTNPTLRQ